MAATTSFSNLNSGCDVFVRWRPLQDSETERGDSAINYKHTYGSKSNTWKIEIDHSDVKENASFDFGESRKSRRPQLRKRGGFKGLGFKGVIEEQENNIETYQKAIEPLVNDTIIQGHTGSCFAYGMTGSGKTHTMLGYEEQGMYVQAAEHIFTKIQEFKEEFPEVNFALSLRFAELYNGHFYNLLDKRKESKILEGVRGAVLLRSTEATEDGLYLSGNIKDVICHSLTDVEDAIQEGLTLRKAGTSTTHDQSSRSHAVIEMEIVTEELTQLRLDNIQFNAELTKAVQTNAKPQKIDKWQRKIAKNLKKQNKEKGKHFSLGGTIAFCDLAGAEIGNSATKVDGEWVSTGHYEKQTQQERLEAKKINTSLMALAEVLKNLQKEGRKRVGYRASPLTMYLRQFLQGNNCKSVMMAAVSPSKSYKRHTVQTLRYAKLLAETEFKRNKKKTSNEEENKFR